MICSVCRAQIGRYAWQPFNVSGSLSIAWTCPNGHQGQYNRVKTVLAPIEKPVGAQLALAPVDLIDV